MRIYYDKIRRIPHVLLFLLMIYVSISFTAFPFLIPISVVLWGVFLIGFMMMSVLFIHRPMVRSIDLLIYAYLLLLFMTTVMHDTEVYAAFMHLVEVSLMVLIFGHCKDEIPQMFKIIAVSLSLIVYANTLQLLAFPQLLLMSDDSGMMFLLGGNYNQMGARMLTAIVVSIMCVKQNRWWLLNVIALFVCSIATLLLVGSMTSVSCICLYAFFCLIPYDRYKRLALYGMFASYLFFQCVVVFSGESLHNNELAVYIVEDVLQKDMTFTNRTEMWDAAARVVAKSPFVGYGVVDKEWYLANMSTFAIGPHNFIYSVLINGGIVLLAVLVAMFFVSAKRVWRSQDTYGLLLLLGIVTMSFMMTMEVYPFVFVFLLLLLAFHYPDYKNDVERIKSLE